MSDDNNNYAISDAKTDEVKQQETNKNDEYIQKKTHVQVPVEERQYLAERDMLSLYKVPCFPLKILFIRTPAIVGGMIINSRPASCCFVH